MTCCEAISDRLDRFAIAKESSCADDALQEMLLFPLFQIGEHSNRLSDEFISADHKVPRHEIIGLRHIIVHSYAKVDPDWVWRIFETDFVNLEQHVASLFPVLSDVLQQGETSASYPELLGAS